MSGMSSTNKGNYVQCLDCKFRIKNSILKYPCEKSHRNVRKSGNVKYERDFNICGLYEKLNLDLFN